MPYPFRRFLRCLGVSFILLFSAVQSFGSHIYGIDLYYTYVSGYTYTINLVVYGDCSGAAFATLPTSTPVINVYNGSTLFTTVTLAINAPVSGTEVTPVCPADASSTTCDVPTSSIPGVKKFVYSANVTLSGPSTVWQFLFQGDMGSGASAGRSNSITNIMIPSGGSMIQLVDTLNNVPGPNSSAVFNTIATPFFCIDVPANYNPAAVDPDGDALTISLVPGIDASTGGSVTYVFPYTSSEPLAVSPGYFAFTSSNGQLSFTPNALQRSLVVYNVEKRNSSGILVGTSQREMSFVVLGSCSGTPPGGAIVTTSAGTVYGSSELNICSNVGAFNFSIDPTAAGDTVNVAASGLPAGSSFNILNNNTPNPICTFSWNTTAVTPGTYTFYVTYTAYSCPLNNAQTIAYTVFIMASPTESISILSEPSCTREGILQIVPGGPPDPWSINVLISGGSSYHTLTGITGTITDSLPPGTYTYVIYNGYGCMTSEPVTLTTPTLPTPVVNIAPPLCVGGSTGSATITGTHGTSPYQYALGSGSYGTADVFTGLAAGTYTLYVKDFRGCVKDTVVTIPNPNPILERLFITQPTCNNYSNGLIVIQGYNTTPPYTYALGTGPYVSTDTFSSLAAGSYTFSVRDGNGCTATTTIVLNDATNIHATLNIIPIPCNGDSATVVVNATSGYGPPYTYTYNTGAFGTSNIFTVPAGTYTLYVHDTDNCYFDTAITLTQPAPLTFSPVITNVLCNDTYTGSVIVDVAGGTPSYMYDTAGGTFSTSSTITGLDSGMHIINVRDHNGCVYADTISLSQPTPLVIDSVSSQMPLCNGGTNGTFIIYASGGTTPYSYAFNTGSYSVSATLTGFATGTYTLYVKDANGCMHDTTVTLAQPTAITSAASVTNSTCSTLANGQVILSATGGTPGYTYAVGSGAYTTSSTFTPLAAGTYVFHIMDNNGCVHDTTISISDSLHISGIFTITPATCYGYSTGAIAVTGAGGSSPYLYDIASYAFSSGNVFSGLYSGVYTIGIEDSNGCIQDTTVSVSQPNAVNPGISITEPTCFGYSNASFTVSPSGGTAPYTTALGSGPFTSAIVYSGLPAGTDTIGVKDANGCILDSIFSILQPTLLTITGLQVTNVSCNGGADGTVTVNASGATPPYKYAANSSPYQFSNLLTGLSAGVQAIYVEDSQNCLADTTVNITQPAPLVFTGADTVDPTCQGYPDGSVMLYASGGTLPYMYSLNNVDFYTSAYFGDLTEGTYTFYISDSNHCTNDTTITLTGYPHIFFDSIQIVEPLCVGEHNGYIIVTGSGGVQPLAYSMTGNYTPDPPSTFDSLTSGEYTITITDSKNCHKDSTVNVPQPDTIAIDFTIKPNECTGYENQGAVSTSVSGGTAPYSYLWNTDTIQNNTSIIAGLANGVYTVWVTDAHGCKDTGIASVQYDDCCTPFIPTAFTPNHDGKDDIFQILYKGDMRVIVFEIYNRFGERVFRADFSDKGWDGTYKGENAEMGVYYYYAKIICGNKYDHVLEFKGDVTLIR